MIFVDLEDLFKRFLEDAVREDPARYGNREALEDAMGPLYEEFLSHGFPALDGLSPEGYADRLRRDGDLEEYVSTCLEKGIEVPEIVSDALVSAGDASLDFLERLLREKDGTALYAASVLSAIGGERVSDMFLKILLDEAVPEETKNAAYGFLREDAPGLPDKALALMNGASPGAQSILAEVLAGYKGSKEIYYWLVTMFMRGEDVPVFAGLLGGYGDPAAIDILKSFAKENDVNYMEYVEIRNAVEELGGYMDVEKNFDGDPYYEYMNGGSPREE